jgi:quinol monooxygenase YgiN
VPGVIVIVAVIDLDPSHRDELIAAAIEMQRASRQEDGCHLYTFSADLEDPGRFYVTEKWDDDAALAAHFAAPHMGTFQAAIAGLGPRTVTATKYDVASEGPVR